MGQRTLLCLGIIAGSILFAAFPCFAFKALSCQDHIAATYDKPGTSPDCLPVIWTKEYAVEFLNKSGAKKINDKWYIFISEKEFSEEVDYSLRWKTISSLVTAVQSLFDEKAECFIVRIPATDEEKAALLEGKYPEKLIAAHGKFAKSEDEAGIDDWPEYHHHLKYSLTVY